jgi:hypothetical protein
VENHFKQIGIQVLQNTYLVIMGMGSWAHGLTTFADADFSRCLHTRRSVSAHFHLLNGVLVLWGCKKQPVTALHSSGAELTSLYCAGFTFMSSIGKSFTTPCTIFEDNQGTIKLI